MKTDLATSIFAAIIGVLVAYFVCNMFLPELENFSITTLSTDINYSLSSPNPEIFNYRAIDPTVEVYVGQCDNYDNDGNCVDATEELDADSTTNEEPTDGTTD